MAGAPVTGRLLGGVYHLSANTHGGTFLKIVSLLVSPLPYEMKHATVINDTWESLGKMWRMEDRIKHQKKSQGTWGMEDGERKMGIDLKQSLGTWGMEDGVRSKEKPRNMGNGRWD